MKPFSEKKNRYFCCCRKLINQALLRDGITVEEMRAIVGKSGFNEYNYEFVQALIGKPNQIFADIQLFDEKKGKYFSLNSSSVPYMTTTDETMWLNSLINRPGIEAFLDAPTLSGIKTLLASKTECHQSKYIFDSDACFSEKTIANLRHALSAIDENTVLCYENHTLKEGLIKGRLAPYRVEFSAKLQGFWLIGYDVDSDKMIKMAMDRFTVFGQQAYEANFDLGEKIALSYKTSHITIEIADANTALERAMHVFSEYKRDSFYDRNRDIHIVDIEYYDFDEYDVMKTLLSLGPYAKIVSQGSQKTSMMDILRKQKEMLK